MAHAFTLSAFVKKQGPGSVRLEVGLFERFSRSYSADGSWQQLTVDFQPNAVGELLVPVRCVVEGVEEGATEAIFDRVMLVAGCVVPHYSNPVATDVGGPLPKLRVRRGVDCQIVLAPEPGKGLAFTLVGKRVDELLGVHISFKARDHLSRSGFVSLDLLRNGRSMLKQALQGLPDARPRGEYLIGTIPPSWLHCRGLEEGDLLELRAPASMEDLQVVLTGRARTI